MLFLVNYIIHDIFIHDNLLQNSNNYYYSAPIIIITQPRRPGKTMSNVHSIGPE